MKERFQLFIGCIVSFFVSDYTKYKYEGNLIKCNISSIRLCDITQNWRDEDVKSIEVYYHDKWRSSFDPEKWRLFGHGILKNCKGITVKVEFK